MKVIKTITTHVLFCVFVLSLLANVFLYKAAESFRRECELLRAVQSIDNLYTPRLPSGIQRLDREA